jgi:hypothetical protein
MFTAPIRCRAALTPCLVGAIVVLVACSSGHSPTGGTAALIPSVHIDAPAPGVTVSGRIPVSGWAIDNDSAVGTAITGVQVLVDGAAVGVAIYGVSRPDVRSSSWPTRLSQRGLHLFPEHVDIGARVPHHHRKGNRFGHSSRHGLDSGYCAEVRRRSSVGL